MQHEVLLSPLVGTQSLLTLDEPEHLAVRMVLRSPFHGERVEPLHEPTPLLPRLQTIALNVILKVIFGTTESPREELMRARFASLLEWGANPLKVLYHQQLILRGRKSPRSFSRLLEPVDAMIFEEIDRAHQDANLEERDDVLGMLVQTRDEDGVAMTGSRDPRSPDDVDIPGPQIDRGCPRVGRRVSCTPSGGRREGPRRGADPRRGVPRRGREGDAARALTVSVRPTRRQAAVSAR